MAESKLLRVGTRVRLCGPELMPLGRHMFAYTTAIIRKIGIHPNTWYTLQLMNGQFVNMRRSAFTVSAISSAPSSSVPISKKSIQRKWTNQFKNSAIRYKVMITAGRGQGETGRIMKSGHGFYSVTLDSSGMSIMKRLDEIQLVLHNSHTTHEDDIDLAASLLTSLKSPPSPIVDTPTAA